jgi:hypothetical protein
LVSAALVLACGVALAASAPSSPEVHAPAATAAQAAADARAAVAAVAIPAGSQRLEALPSALRGSIGPDYSQAYATFATATEYWQLANAGAAATLLAQAPKGSSSWSNWASWSQGVQITLPAGGSWMGPRWVVIAATADPGHTGRWVAAVSATFVWTPYRLELPGDSSSVTVSRLQGGSVLARVSDAKRVAAIVAVIDALAVDDAVHAVYACPAEPAGEKPGFELSFADASGAVVATASTEPCPPDVSLRVGRRGPQQLILGDLRAQLQRILGISLPPVF